MTTTITNPQRPGEAWVVEDELRVDEHGRRFVEVAHTAPDPFGYDLPSHKVFRHYPNDMLTDAEKEALHEYHYAAEHANCEFLEGAACLCTHEGDVP